MIDCDGDGGADGLTMDDLIRIDLGVDVAFDVESSKQICDVFDSGPENSKRRRIPSKAATTIPNLPSRFNKAEQSPTSQRNSIQGGISHTSRISPVCHPTHLVVRIRQR